ncbi:MAG: restriction endonuclease [Burkholderiales bacterium]|nr:restriction endonuclease [Burkholderiales bacterium]
MWMVRAGEGGVRVDEFRAGSVVAIGWEELGDMSSLHTREQFTKAVERAYPGTRRMQVAMSAGQAYRFAREIKKHDRVVTYDPSRREYLLGTVTGDYNYKPATDGSYPQLRSVQWDATVSRDVLSVATRNSLGAIATLFLLPTEAADEIEQIAAGTVAASTAPAAPVEEQTQVDLIFKDIQNKAFEFIKDKISRLDWDEMQELVAGLLRAMGYKTRISPSGPDRGKDIVASPDGFGFESPRIVVEVKHRTASAMGSPEVRSFLGGRHKDDKGLYVSTGGFSREARYEAERASIPLTLMDLDDLVRAVLEHYERMDTDSQRLLALRKIYWPG